MCVKYSHTCCINENDYPQWSHFFFKRKWYCRSVQPGGLLKSTCATVSRSVIFRFIANLWLSFRYHHIFIYFLSGTVWKEFQLLISSNLGVSGSWERGRAGVTCPRGTRSAVTASLLWGSLWSRKQTLPRGSVSRPRLSLGESMKAAWEWRRSFWCRWTGWLAPRLLCLS